jgi:hypothetical protein
MSVQKKRQTAESKRSATVHVPNTQPTVSSFPVVSTRRDVSGSQHLSASRYEYSNHLFSFSQSLLTCNERQTYNDMSGITHTPAQLVGRGREEQENPSLILGSEHLGRSILYISATFASVNILIVNVKMMETMMIMMMILLIQQAL